MKAMYGLVIAAMVFSGGCASKKEEKRIAKEISIFQKPKDATARIEGQKFSYCLWYDPNQWMIWDTPFHSKNEPAEWNLVLLDMKERESLGKETKIKAETSTYPYQDKSLSKKEFKSLIQERIVKKASLEVFEDLKSEDRIVNGYRVLAWNFKFKYADAEEITALVYFYSDSLGSVAIVSYTPSRLWEENKHAMEDLLNGFCLLQNGA